MSSFGIPVTPDVFQNALILAGPTASGKTALALELAERLDAEIVGMDSMTLYRGMDLGTAKPTPEERGRVPHHLIDVLDPWESANVAWWLAEAAKCVRDIEARGKQALFVGGTPFYLKALLCGLFESPPADEALRRRLELEAEAEGRERFHARLAAVDPTTAARLHPNDVRRVVRALEVWELTGRPISAFQRQWGWGGEEPNPPAPFPKKEGGVQGSLAPETEQAPQDDRILNTPFLLREGGRGVRFFPRCLALDVPRAELYARINARVRAMIDAGWLDEVRRLRELPRPLSREASQALGYRELIVHLEGGMSLDAAVELIQTRTRQFAKRQLTWFRNLPGCLLCEGKLTFVLWQSRMR